MKTLVSMIIILLLASPGLLGQEDGTGLQPRPAERPGQRSVVYDEGMMTVMDMEHREFLLHHVPRGCELMAIRLVIMGIDWKSPRMIQVKLLCEDLAELLSNRFLEIYMIARTKRDDPLKQILPRHSAYFATVSSAGWVGNYPGDASPAYRSFLTAASVLYSVFFQRLLANSASQHDYSLPPGAPGVYRHSGEISRDIRDRSDMQTLDVHERMEAEKRISR